jgi:hypothetical protein
MTTDLLANAERVPDERPIPSAKGELRAPGCWTGSASSLVQHWRDRAVRAEAIVERLTFEISALRYRPC